MHSSIEGVEKKRKKKCDPWIIPSLRNHWRNKSFIFLKLRRIPMLYLYFTVLTLLPIKA